MNIYRKENILTITGLICSYQISKKLFSVFCQEIDTGVTHLDLKGVEQADSACISLLLCALRRNPDIVFQNIPHSVYLLLNLYELDNEVKILQD